VFDVIYHAGYRDTSLLHGPRNDGIAPDGLNGHDDIELGQAVRPVIIGGQAVELGLMSPPQPPDGFQPGVEGAAQIGIPHGSLSGAAAGVAAHDDVLDADQADGEVDGGGGAGIVVGSDDVADVAVHEYLAGLAVAHGGLGNARVGAAQPQHLRLLGLGQGLEQLRLAQGGAVGKYLVARDDAIEGVVWGGGNMGVSV
jgi:hypothetical protein